VATSNSYSLLGSNDGTTGQGADCWLTVTTHFDGTVDNTWPDMWYPNVSFETWMHALELMRAVPRAMSNKVRIYCTERYRGGSIPRAYPAASRSSSVGV
jgi:hypothetical protein